MQINFPTLLVPHWPCSKKKAALRRLQRLAETVDAHGPGEPEAGYRGVKGVGRLAGDT